MNAIEAYPLCWPVDYKRTQFPKRGAFKTTINAASNGIINELRRFGAKNVIISSNMQINAKGIPYSRQMKITDTGVAVYFDYEEKQHVLCSDKWLHLEDNLRAIELTISAMRGMDRWGVSEILERMFTGFKSLPSQTNTSWWQILQIEKNASAEQKKTVYRELSKKYHPDNLETGNAEKFIQIKNAYEEAIKS